MGSAKIVPPQTRTSTSDAQLPLEPPKDSGLLAWLKSLKPGGSFRVHLPPKVSRPHEQKPRERPPQQQPPLPPRPSLPRKPQPPPRR